MGEVGAFRFTDAMGGSPDHGRRPLEAQGLPDAGESDGPVRPELRAATEALTRFGAAIADERARVIEEWCERSLTDPEGRGVAIVNDGPMRFYIGLDASVPFGTIHEYESPPWGTEG